MVLCGLWNTNVIGPFFFKGTINRETYMLTLGYYCRFMNFQGKPEWLKQDGTLPYYALLVCCWLHETVSG